jgi:transketolase
MTKLETLQLKLTATRVRMGVIEATHGAGCGHPGGSLSGRSDLSVFSRDAH